MTNARVISFEALIKNVGKRWRRMLVFAAIFFVLGAGYRALRLFPRLESSAVKEETLENALEQTDAESGLDVTRELEIVEKTILEKGNYIENSFIAQINPMACPKATATISVTTEEMQNTGAPVAVSYDKDDGLSVIDGSLREANRILNAYLRYFHYGMQWGDLLDTYQTEARYFNELLSVGTVRTDVVSADIIVSFPTEQGAGELMQQVIDELYALQESVTENYGEHELQINNQYVAIKGSDRTYYGWMNERLTEMNSLFIQRDNFKNYVKSLGTSTAVQSSGISRQTFIKSCLRYGAVGFVGGLILYVVLCMSLLVLSGVVLSGDELNRQYHLNRLSAIPNGSENAGAWTVAYENIKHLSGQDSTIALVGDVSVGAMEETRKALSDMNREGGSYISLTNLNTNPEALSGLQACDGVVMLAQVNQSHYQKLNEILETVQAYEKPVIGSIVLQ